MASYWTDTAVIAAVDAVTALLNSGTIKIYSSTAPTTPNASLSGDTVLATMTFGSTAFVNPATASSGTVTATANSITSGTAGNTGTATFFALLESGGTVIVTGSVGTSGADLNLSSLSITSGATVSCSSFTITMSETGS